MFAHCKGPVWNVDDFSKCFQRDYLQTLFPLIAVGGSLIYLCFQLFQAAKRSRYYHAYKALDNVHHVWSIHVPNREEVDTDEDEDEDDYLTLQPTISQTQPSVINVDKPRGERWLVTFEELVVLGELAIQIAALATKAWGPHGTIAGIAEMVAWAYIATLASLRLLSTNSLSFSFPRLWYHTLVLYSFQWVFTVLLFRSALIHPRSHQSRSLMIANFVLSTLLLLIALLSRKGNKAIELEYEGDIPPSKEPLASVFSLATFAWVDSLIWDGYKKSFELADVWNLMAKDKAAAVLADYRQVKKTNVLAFHLTSYFKRAFIIQALWSALRGLNLFAPTLLLKAILEYVENPASVPQNAAWFYVILLFVSGCISAVSGGQSLWIGRKICIRLRAIIIGEIYAKALRRRAAAGADKVLGQSQKAKDEKVGLLKKLMCFGRKKKVIEVAKPDTKLADASEQVTSGTIINLMAVDSFKLSEISAYLHFLWAETPVQVVVAVLLLYSIMGSSSIVGIGMMIFLLPINIFIANRFSAIQKQILAATDVRIHTTNEVLTNIRIIKFFAWEQRFIGQVEEVRAKEMRRLRDRYIIWAIAATIWSGAPVLITFLSFLVYTMVEAKPLPPSIAFTALSLFTILRVPLDQVADMVAHVQESKVSVDRIEEYLNEPESEKYRQLKNEEVDENENPVIGFDRASFSWGGRDTDDFRLMDLDVKFKVGQLNTIIGPTGSGKTSLLMALLGEMTLLNGNVYLPGGRSREDRKPDPDTGLTESVAYCAQQAWLVNGTIKENITFASPWDASRYRNVISACSLRRDLEILDHGDNTLVGEKGVTLSGGQKQRISLARALYCNARHVLLDDVLSAVDSHTAKWIFDKALLGPLMWNRTCILVTHNAVLCLPQTHTAVVLDNGRITAQGSPTKVINSGMLGEDLTRSRPVSRAASIKASRASTPAEQETANEEDGHANGMNGNSGTQANGASKPQDSDDEDDIREAQKEGKAVGRVKFRIIFMYLSAMGPWYYWVFAGLVFGLQQISNVSTNVWIRQWANAYDRSDVRIQGGAHHNSPLSHVQGHISSASSCLTSGSCIWSLPLSLTEPSQPALTVQGVDSAMDAPPTTVNAGYYLGVYAILGVVYMVITLIREGVLFGGSLAASRRIHSRLMQSIMHAKFRFFDTTPLGQIMNRFSRDIENVDQEIAPVAVGVVHCLFSILTIVILISVITPPFLIAAVLIALLYIGAGYLYINSSRDLKRIESIQRSPLYQQFGETLSGMVTIRAYGDERRFVRDNLSRVNAHNRPFIYVWATNRWLAFRADVIGSLISFCTAMFVILSVGRVDAGAAGLALTYAVTFTENMLWFVRLYASNEQNMNSVERIQEYIDVDQEAEAIVPESRPPTGWPEKGGVEFKEYSTRYREDFDLVLKGISFKIQPGEKVGVVGRTGAGKSSLAMALFRALEAEEGKIFVDGIDIGTIGLQDLRENIVMVPQDPTLFTGTIRSNLDPFNLFTDEEIFTALRRVQLVGPPSTSGANSPATPLTSSTSPTTPIHQASPVSPSHADNKNIFLNLSSPVAESGTNLSQGQRQLLCLARALLKNPRVLLMDEATASIDYATDGKIQETIREIRNTTVTIAHRLQTIVDYDKVLVLDRGEVVEFGGPWELLRADEEEGQGGDEARELGIKKAGIFRGMCEMSGDLEVLEKEAKRAWEARRLVDDS
ncbi:putative ABC transporter [Viridothelium virens]|uniref:Putative ABC transporter n=1 Tax=Viridothelium virens TaxID=1048519 RepID=A0A6A6H1B9_VIRVR|nr:putative ABC transporter [Viridothelium virens]